MGIEGFNKKKTVQEKLDEHLKHMKEHPEEFRDALNRGLRRLHGTTEQSPQTHDIEDQAPKE